MWTYQVVSSEKTALVGSRELPEEADSNKSREQPNNHDNGSDVLELTGAVRTSEHENGSAETIRNAISSGQKRILGKSLDNKLVEVGNTTVDDLVEEGVEEKEPDLAILEDLHNLRLLNLAVENTSSALGILSNKHSSLLNSISLSGKNVVREEEEQENSPADSQATAENVDDSPNFPALGLTDSVEENTAKHAAETVEAVEETGSGGLSVAAEPLGDDQHEGGGDDGFKGSEEEATDGKAGEVGAGGCAEEDCAPGADESGDDFASRETLGEVGGGPFSDEVGKVEDTSFVSWGSLRLIRRHTWPSNCIHQKSCQSK